MIFLSSTGYLLVNVRTALGALPVAGALVTVTGAGEPINSYTDMSGKSERIELSTPDLASSLTPGASLPPYSSYDVKVEADGYNTVRTVSVPVFPGIVSVQNINMIALQGYNGEDVPEEQLNFDESRPFPVEGGYQ